ncbi:LCP family protein [Nonomuraea sp. NPDC000554]|uniref:LCP family protein n=1 Tax=Nonomuraea sp. NPDC000554 TaxID=3154259 RepID=UPI003327C2C0
MSKRDGEDAVPGSRKPRAPRRSRPASDALPPEDAPAQNTPTVDVRAQNTPTVDVRAQGARPKNPRPKSARTKETRPAKGARPRGSAPRFAKPLTLGSVVGWTALSVIVPGAAHLRAGHRRTGLALVGVYAVLLLAALAYGLTRNESNLTAFAGEGAQVTVIVVASAGALAWFALLVTSYVALTPNRLNQQGQIVSGIVVGVLCVSVMAPFALTANTVLTFKETIDGIFPSAPDPDVPVVASDSPDPWGGKKRVNFLLIGGDAAGDRTGVRTDSMNVASVNTETGDTVLFSLPRNLQHVRFPPTSPLHKQFPNGFMAELPNGGLLNEVWQYANENPQVMGGHDKGPRALMDAIGYTLNLKIDYYAMMNMYGFADLVDAIGGLKIRVERDVKWGGHFGTAGTIKAGYKRLSGEEALWYGRSRVESDDFSRMARQRCVIGAFAQQATPDKILLNFTKIAGAAKRLARTNIPKQLVQPLVELAVKVKNGKITSLQFVPPEFYSGRPDWLKIRRAAAKAIADSGKTTRRAEAADVTASPGSPSTSPSTSPSRVHAAKPTQTPTRNSQAKSLSELCGL